MSKKTGIRSGCLCALFAIPVHAASLGLVPISATGTYAIDGHEIILVCGGQHVTMEVRAADWGPHLLRIFQVHLDVYSFVSGEAGTAFPLGWDRDFEMPGCATDDDCPEGQICTETWLRCAGPNHDPEIGWFTDTSRTDYIFYGVPSINNTNNYADYVEYRQGDTVLLPTDSIPYTPPAKYGATLILDVSEDAAGTFTIGFITEELSTALFDDELHYIQPIEILTAQVTIVEPGCGNGVC
ncbi:MAG: hypothetical protein PVI86_11725, partial [Phycisphaerae bacterium]